MSFGVEPGTDQLPVAVRGIEVLPLLADASPPGWHRRHPVVAEAGALRPHSGVEHSDDGPLPESGPRPGTTGREVQPQESVRVRRVQLKPAVGTNRDDAGQCSQRGHLIFSKPCREAFERRVVRVQEPRRSIPSSFQERCSIQEGQVPMELILQTGSRSTSGDGMRVELDNVGMEAVGIEGNRAPKEQEQEGGNDGHGRGLVLLPHFMLPSQQRNIGGFEGAAERGGISKEEVKLVIEGGLSSSHG